MHITNSPQIPRQIYCYKNNYITAVTHWNKLNTDTVNFTSNIPKLAEFTISEYNHLSEIELIKLRNLAKQDILKYNILDEKAHDIASDNVISYLNNKYGKDNYFIIIIGRSISSIGKVIGYKIGENNVVNVPLSGAQQYSVPAYMTLFENNGNLEVFKQYLKTIGITKDKLKASGKTCIIMDYCISGKGLKGVFDLFTRDDILGKENVVALDILTCIEKNEKFTCTDTLKSYLDVCLYKKKYKDLAFVNKAKFLTDVPEASKIPVNSREDQLFRFKLLDNFMRKQ